MCVTKWQQPLFDYLQERLKPHYMVDDINWGIFLMWVWDEMHGLQSSLTHNFGFVATTKAVTKSLSHFLPTEQANQFILALRTFKNREFRLNLLCRQYGKTKTEAFCCWLPYGMAGTQGRVGFLFKLRSAHQNSFLVQLTEKPVKLVAHLQCTQCIDGGREVHAEWWQAHRFIARQPRLTQQNAGVDSFWALVKFGDNFGIIQSILKLPAPTLLKLITITL